jgi:hypothetical protein
MTVVDDMPLNARSLSFKWDTVRYVISFDSAYLTVDRQATTYSETTRTPLTDLCPEFRRRRWVPDSAFRLGKEARYLLLLAVIVYFSAIHAYVPLLAPLALLLGLFLWYKAFRRGWPAEKTIIDSDTEAVVTIPHYKRIESARKAFEEALSRAITRAREETDEED